MATPAKKTPAKKSPAKKDTKRTAGPDVSQFICNVVPSKDTETDWQFGEGVAAAALSAPKLPKAVDLRAPWWSINNQRNTGSCVGWATADGMVRYQLTKAGRLATGTLLSPRFVWMASKETDTITARPETFIEDAGTTLKAAVDVCRKFGCALMTELPFDIATTMYLGGGNTFYASCATRKIAAYFNLRRNLDQWKSALAQGRPILAAFSVDESWDQATSNGGNVDTFKPATVRGGHAIAVVGYRADGRFIVRNSWGTSWGDKGFAYVKPTYIAKAFYDESYAVTL